MGLFRYVNTNIWIKEHRICTGVALPCSESWIIALFTPEQVEGDNWGSWEWPYITLKKVSLGNHDPLWQCCLFMLSLKYVLWIYLSLMSFIAFSLCARSFLKYLAKTHSFILNTTLRSKHISVFTFSLWKPAISDLI